MTIAEITRNATMEMSKSSSGETQKILSYANMPKIAMDVKARTLQNRPNETTTSLFQGYSNESSDLQMISHDNRTTTPVSFSSSSFLRIRRFDIDG